VLIIDDDPTARLALAALMAPDDYRIAFATDASEVRSRLPLINPDVILCDLVMADMCGDEFIRWLQSQERWSLVPVVAVTRIDNAIVRADLLLSGADIVLVKPCSGPELRAHVKAALRTRRKYARLAARAGDSTAATHDLLQRPG
jgi:DNA-binding response OmpR family regulator